MSIHYVLVISMCQQLYVTMSLLLFVMLPIFIFGFFYCLICFFFFFSSRRRHTRLQGDWSSDVCSSDLQLGGSVKAVALSCLAILCSIIYLALYSLNSMNAFEPLFWTGCLYCVVLAMQRNDPRWWLLFGALAGLSLENKHSTLFFGAAVFLALLLTPARRFLASRWIWLGAGLAVLLFLPNAIWQVQHNFPTLEDLRNVSRMHKNVALSPGQFL